MTRWIATAIPCLAALACKVPDPPAITEAWTESFERSELGGDYRPTAKEYRIKSGVLHVRGAFNHPLWLRKKLPKNVSIEFDCWSDTSDGDLKVELFGDGEHFAKDKGQYTSTGYVAVMGGWHNTKSLLARGNEHGAHLVERKQPTVKIGKRYRWKLVRKGEALDWFIDGELFLSLADKDPLYGPGHHYFAFNNWQSDAHFDNLVIAPLGE